MNFALAGRSRVVASVSGVLSFYLVALLCGVTLAGLTGCQRPRVPSPQELARFNAAGPSLPAISPDQLPQPKAAAGPYRVVAGDVLEFRMQAGNEPPQPAEPSASGRDNGPDRKEPAPAKVLSGPDRVAVGDVVEFLMPAILRGVGEDLPDKTSSYACRVTEAGSVWLPVVGEMPIAGKNLLDIEAAVVASYFPKYVKNRPSVIARITERRAEFKLFREEALLRRVGESGGIRLPFVGEVPAAGKTLAEIEDAVAAQTESGGWDYNFTSERNRGDTSVTGWQVMALKSAKRAGIEFPEEALTKAREFLNVVYRDGFVGYSNVDRWWSTPALTAAGVNAALYSAIDADAEDVHAGLGVILRNLPEEPKPQGTGWSPHANIYLWYHGNLALSRLGGQEWRFWNDRLKPLFCRLQAREGYWDTYGDPWRDYGGRIYFTALAICALEVYYRYD